MNQGSIEKLPSNCRVSYRGAAADLVTYQEKGRSVVESKSFDLALLERLRSVACTSAFRRLDGHFKRDSTFTPRKDPNTERWHCATANGECELLVNGPKWYDTRARLGGGGSIDLVMQLYRLDFVDAVNLLVERGI